MIDSLHSDKEIVTRPMCGLAGRQLCRDIFPDFKGAMADAGFVASFPPPTRIS